ncbi:Hypothetical protein EAG7_04330 [Klebsiella aerogenes]|nr:Hypothetical protein EAG7_04330 [Klebsiella aerogenes]CCG32826.1 hypothetical protein [Klebsiella aerogenes EA1509E]
MRIADFQRLDYTGRNNIIILLSIRLIKEFLTSNVINIMNE